MGIVCAIGNNQHQVLDSLLNCRSGLRPVHFMQTKHTQYPVGEVRLSNTELQQLCNVYNTQSRATLLSMVAIQEAIQQARLSKRHLSYTAFISSTCVGGMDLTEQYFSEFAHDNFDNNTIHEHQCGYHTRFIADHFDLRFPTTVSTACSSALNAMILGVRMIQSGITKRVIVGGTECLTRYHFNGFRSLHILDEQPCRPFDANRAGINLGEGAAYLVLESAVAAKSRKAQPIAWLTGMGNACDAFHQTASSDNGQGAYLAMMEALETAGVKAEEISYLNAHGTGTPNNDQSESVAINRVFNHHLPLISSTKSFTGHTTAASGAIESVICLLAMQNRFAPVNLNWQNPMPDGIYPVVKATKQIDFEHVMCNAFGFGGNDSSVLFSLRPRSPKQTHVEYKTFYIHQASQISDHSLFDKPIDTTKYISSGEARRMSPIMKNALATALDCLGDNTADAIISGTALGCISDTEKFLTQIDNNNEELLSPTLFMQSTHNTISSLIAIRTAAHCYNSTYSQGESSFDNVMTDVLSQFALLKKGHKNILAGFYDDPTVLDKCLLQQRYNQYQNINLQSTAVSILFSDQPSACAITDYLGYAPKKLVMKYVESFFCSDSDNAFILLGINGNNDYDQLYQDIFDSYSDKYLLHYKHLFGDGLSSTAVGAWVAAQCIFHYKIPDSLKIKESSINNPSTIILVNFIGQGTATVMRFVRHI